MKNMGQSSSQPCDRLLESKSGSGWFHSKAITAALLGDVEFLAFCSKGQENREHGDLETFLQNMFFFVLGGGNFSTNFGWEAVFFVWFRFVSKFRFVWILGCEILKDSEKKRGALLRENQNLQLISPRMCHPVVGSGCTW